MLRNFLLLYNPISGKGDTKKILNIYNKYIALYPNYNFYTHQTDATAEYEAVKKIIKTENITDVIIAGGDGSVNQVVHALHHLPIKFGIVPRGSGNGLALAAGLPTNYNKALQFILNNKAKPTDAFLINNKFACMLAGLGFDAQVAADFAVSPTRGLTTYTKLVFKNLIKAKPYPFKITTNNITVEVESYLTCIANSNQFGNRFTIAPKAKLDDGLLDIVIIGKMNKLFFLLQTLKQVTGFNKLIHVENLTSNKAMLYFQTPDLIITNVQNAPLHIDGEAAATYKHFDIKVLPHYFNLIRK